jgi:predicted permease
MRLVLRRLKDFEVGEVRSSLIMLFGAVVGVLLITCLHLALLLLVRGSVKSHEIGVRLALGCSRMRLVQGLLLESGILAIVGGLLGTILAKEMLPLLLSIMPSDLPLNSAIGIDRRVILFSACLSMLTPIIFGLAPAIKATGFGLKGMAGQSARVATASLAQARLGNTLVTVQTTLAMVLLSAAILQLRVLVRLQSQPLGFDPQNLLVAQGSLTAKQYETAAATAHLLARIGDQLRSNPGIESVAGVSGLPLDNALNLPVVPDGEYNKAVYSSEYWIVSGDYLTAMRIHLIAGQTFSGVEGKDTPPVAIISENLAKQWWPRSTAVGHWVTAGYQLGPKFADRPRQIIGVVADTYAAGAHQAPPPALFVPLEQTPDPIVAFANKQFLISIIVRVRGSASVEEQIRQATDSADPSLPLADLRPLAEIARISLSRPRFYASLASIFGTFAVLLTAIGLYGLLGYRVSLRTREIAVRMALGAPRSQVIAMVVGQGVKLVAVGLFLGFIGAYYVRQLLGSMLYNHTGLGVIFYAALLLGVVAALTSFLTALQAASVEPMVILRSE